MANSDSGLSPAAIQGARRMVTEYLEVPPGGSLLLLVRPERRSLAEKLADVAESCGYRTTVHLSDVPFEEILPLIDGANCAAFLEGTESTHREGTIGYMSRHDAQCARIVRAFDFSRELLEQAFSVPRAVITRLNANLIGLGGRSTRVRVVSGLGTDLTIRLDPVYGWINSHGRSSGRTPGVLPPAEVATYSECIEGILRADGALNTNFGFPFDPRLRECPVTVEITAGRIRKVSCENILVSQVIRSFMQVENAVRVGEVGFGTNIGLSDFVPFLSHINERYPALHLGFGGNNQGEERVGWQCPLHLDLILGDCDIFFDGEHVLHNGEYAESLLSAQYAGLVVDAGHADTI